MAARRRPRTWRSFWRRRKRWFARSFRRAAPPVLRVLVLVALALAILPPIAVAFFSVIPIPLTPVMVADLVKGKGLVRVPVPLNEVSPALVDAVIASEDARFCLHDGFDWRAIKAANAANAKGDALRGASTISMQTAKNVFLWPGRNWLRKGFEAYTTFFLEHLWSKRRILETYLNVAEWGPGIYGIEAAARYHFQTRAHDLTLTQAARLAVILPNPVVYEVDSVYAIARAGTIARRASDIRAQGLDRCVRTP